MQCVGGHAHAEVMLSKERCDYLKLKEGWKPLRDKNC